VDTGRPNRRIEPNDARDAGRLALLLVTPAASRCSAIASGRLVLPIPPGPVSYDSKRDANYAQAT
jgi:hypothetical protein